MSDCSNNLFINDTIRKSLSDAEKLMDSPLNLLHATKNRKRWKRTNIKTRLLKKWHVETVLKQ